MSNFKLFSLILGFLLCTLTSAADPKEMGEIKNNIAKISSVVEQVLKKMEENSKKISNIEEILSQFIDQKVNDTVDEVFGEFRSKCRSMCEVKGHSVANQTKATLENQLEQLETCLIEDNQKAVNVCSPNPCNGGQCEVSGTGSGYICSNCPNKTYGNNCQKLQCEEANSCFLYKDTGYYVFDVKLEWEVANQQCLSLGMTLATPKDKGTNQFLESQLRPIYGYDVTKDYVCLWMGLKSEANGSGWRWTDGSPLEEYTGGNEYFKSPTSQQCSLLCLTMVNFTWAPNPCDRKWYPLCEKPVSV